MGPLTYAQFIDTVRVAQGPFSYRFVGLAKPMVCCPMIYVARNWQNGLPAR